MLVFVYGTLKRGHSNHRVLGPNPQFVGVAITNTKYKMHDAGFPVLLDLTKDDKVEGHQVEGEVYDVDAETAARLDQLEGKGRMYNRVRKYVRMEEGSVRLNYYVGIPQYWERFGNLRFHKPVANGNLNWPEGRPNASSRVA